MSKVFYLTSTVLYVCSVGSFSEVPIKSYFMFDLGHIFAMPTVYLKFLQIT